MQNTQHPDDAAVDALATAMKAKLAKQRAKGYGGWNTDCTQQRLSDMLRTHVEKGDPVDVANFCAFLLARGEAIAAAQQAVQADVPDGWKWVPVEPTEQMGQAAADYLGVCMKARGLWKAMVEAAPAHPAEGVPAPMPVPYPHHCTARTADGFCEECEGHAQAMAEWNAERAAIAAAHPSQQGMDDLHKQMLKALESVGAHTVTDCDGDEITAYFCNWQAISDAKRAAQAKQGGAA